jgi:drug/metabolite transporter (DMT)-like permease
VGAVELAIVLVSAGLHAFWSVAIKGSGDAVVFNVLQSLLASALALALFPFVDFRELPPGIWLLVAGTSLAHCVYFYGLSRALEEADISLVYPIARSTPAFLPLAAVPLLGETVSLAGALGIGTVFAGMWLVNVGRRPDWRAFLQPGIGFAYLTLAATVAYGLLDKAAMSELEGAAWTSPIPRPIFYFFALYLGCSLLYVPLGLWQRGGRLVEIARSEWRGVVVAVAFSIGSYGLILEALRTAPASYVVAVRQASVLFVLALSVRRLGERPGASRALGALLTVLGVALIAVAP